jgi:cysteine synthase A
MTVRDGFAGAVGNTPLIRLAKLSEETGCEILGKAEFLNPGGSVKDRAALYIVRDAEKRGTLKPGGTVVEGTAGNTGIGLAHICAARGLPLRHRDPRQPVAGEDGSAACARRGGASGAARSPIGPRQLPEDRRAPRRRTAGCDLGAAVRQRGQSPGALRNHGPRDLARYGGTSRRVRERGGNRRNIGRHRALPEGEKARRENRPRRSRGSALYSWVKTGELKAEGSSITEGIGTTRITANFEGTPVDDAVRVDDQAMVSMVYRLLREEGLYVGGSTGINVAAALEVAKALGPGHTIVTLLCDRGSLYFQRLFNPQWLREKGLHP